MQHITNTITLHNTTQYNTNNISRDIIQAIRAYSKALRLCPTNVTAASGLAEAYITQGKLEDAVLS